MVANRGDRMNKQKLEEMNHKEIKLAIRRREEELLKLSSGMFNRVHREQYQKVVANIERLKKRLEEL